jgi:hypothetical protein
VAAGGKLTFFYYKPCSDFSKLLMSRLRKQAAPAATPDIHYVRIQDVDTSVYQNLPVLHVMKDYDRVLANGETRPFQMADFFFESGEPLPHVNVGMMSKMGKFAAKVKKKAKSTADAAKKKAKEMKEKAKKAMDDAKAGYNDEMDGDKAENTETMTLSY